MGKCVSVIADLCNLAKNHAILRLTGYLGNFAHNLLSGLCFLCLISPKLFVIKGFKKKSNVYKGVHRSKRKYGKVPDPQWFTEMFNKSMLYRFVDVLDVCGWGHINLRVRGTSERNRSIR